MMGASGVRINGIGVQEISSLLVEVQSRNPCLVSYDRGEMVESRKANGAQCNCS